MVNIIDRFTELTMIFRLKTYLNNHMLLKKDKEELWNT